MIIKSVAAGIMIGMACVISLTINHPIASPILFSIGLLIICMRRYNLFTGKIGYLNLTDIKQILIILFGNALGIAIMVFLKPIDTSNLVNAKLATPLYMTFFNAIMCGLLMFIAVDTYKQGSKLGIFAAVSAFIICGFEHSIADMYYIFNTPITSEKIIFLVVVIFGNAIGANLHRGLNNEY